MVIADYFTHGTGDFFNVDSYSSISYKDIPTYSATRVDPEVAEPTGEYDLRDTVDFRPRVADATTTTQTLQNQTVYRVTSYSLILNLVLLLEQVHQQYQYQKITQTLSMTLIFMLVEKTHCLLLQMVSLKWFVVQIQKFHKHLNRLMMQ